LNSPANAATEETKPLLNQEPQKSPLIAFFLMMKKAALLAWRHLLALAVVFFVSFVVFPAVITDQKFEFMQGIHNTDLRIGWEMLIYIFLFNLFDTVGRWLGG
jgi:L-lactate permease